MTDEIKKIIIIKKNIKKLIDKFRKKLLFFIILKISGDFNKYHYFSRKRS